MSYTENGSFKFGDIDMYDEFGIQILDYGIPNDLLIPKIKDRKVDIPLRHGKYDYGAKYYEERQLTLSCVTTWGYENNSFRSMMRDIAYILSKKDKLRLWYEPDKYYIGRVENEITLTHLSNTANAFDLEFTCDAFAYGKDVSDVVNSFKYDVNYKGTVSTPTRIIITNMGNTTIKNLVISHLHEKTE